MAAQHVPRDLVRPSSGFQQLAQKKTTKQDKQCVNAPENKAFSIALQTNF